MQSNVAQSGMELKTIGVLGAGIMGSAIAQVCAGAGYSVVLRDMEKNLLERGQKLIEDSLGRLLKKGTITEPDRTAILKRIDLTTEIAKASVADFVIEAVTEDAEVKKGVFRELDRAAKPHAIFATNTSSLSVTELARVTLRPERFVGMHFFNPVPVMKLVEVIRTPLTSEETFRTAWDLAKKLQKEPIAAQDTPGFIFNRLIIPYLNEAMWALYEGVGSIQDIDRAMKLGGNMPIGPLQLLDLVGIDVQLHACETLYGEFGDPKFRPCPLNRQMVRAGLLGRKSGKGFYDYSANPPVPVRLRF